MPDNIKLELAARVPNCTGEAAEMMFWVLNDLKDYPSCKACDTKLSSYHWEPFLKTMLRTNPDQKQGYRPYCGRECSYKYGTKPENYKKTCIDRYGVAHPMKTEEVIAKIKATNIDKHGEQFPNRWTGEKFLSTIQDKYGTETVRYIPGVSQKTALSKQEQTQKLLPRKIKEIEKLFEVECISDIDELRINATNIRDVDIEWQHSCGRRWFSTISERGIRRCPTCSSGTSRGEHEVAKFIESLGHTVVQRDRSVIAPRELDIWIPEKKIAIEFDGTYWHSAKFEDRQKSMQKVELCQ